jgi:hypothetical protein
VGRWSLSLSVTHGIHLQISKRKVLEIRVSKFFLFKDEMKRRKLEFPKHLLQYIFAFLAPEDLFLKASVVSHFWNHQITPTLKLQTHIWGDSIFWRIITGTYPTNQEWFKSVLHVSYPFSDISDICETISLFPKLISLKTIGTSLKVLAASLPSSVKTKLFSLCCQTLDFDFTHLKYFSSLQFLDLRIRKEIKKNEKWICETETVQTLRLDNSTQKFFIIFTKTLSMPSLTHLEVRNIKMSYAAIYNKWPKLKYLLFTPLQKEFSLLDLDLLLSLPWPNLNQLHIYNHIMYVQLYHITTYPEKEPGFHFVLPFHLSFQLALTFPPSLIIQHFTRDKTALAVVLTQKYGHLQVEMKINRASVSLSRHQKENRDKDLENLDDMLHRWLASPITLHYPGLDLTATCRLVEK